MRGDEVQQQARFRYLSPEARVPQDHPLRPIKKMVNQAVQELAPEFRARYPRCGRPSIPPEQLLRVLLLQVFYSSRRIRLLLEQLQYNLLFRWFPGLAMADPVWDHSGFSKNQERFLASELAAVLFPAFWRQPGRPVYCRTNISW